MRNPKWVADIIDAIDAAIGNKSIGKEELADGLEEIEDKAGEWARQMRDELQS